MTRPDSSGLSFQKRKEKFASVSAFGEIPKIPASRIDERIDILRDLLERLEDQQQKDEVLYQYNGAAFANCFERKYDPDGKVIRFLVDQVRDERRLAEAITYEQYRSFVYATIASNISGLETLLGLAERFQLSRDIVVNSQCLKQCVQRGDIGVMELFLVKLPTIVTKELFEQKIREREVQPSPYNHVSDGFKLYLRNPALDQHLIEVRSAMERERVGYYELTKSDKYPTLPPIPEPHHDYRSQAPGKSAVAVRSAGRADERGRADGRHVTFV